MNEAFENEIYCRRRISRLALGMLIGGVLIHVAAALISLIIYRFEYSVSLDTNMDVILSAVCVYFVGMPVIYLILRNIRHVHPLRNPITVGGFLKLFALSYALAYVSNFIGSIATVFLSTIKGAPIENKVFDTVMGTNVVTEIIFIVILAPVIEELVFRKLIIDRTLIFGDKTAIFISALFFGLFHGNFSQFIYAFTLGIIFGYVYIRTGNIKVTMGLHSLMNFFGSVVASGLIKLIDVEELFNVYTAGDPEKLLEYFGQHSAGMLAISAYGIFVLVLVILGLVVLFTNRMRLKVYEGEITIPRENFVKTTLLNVGMILFILYFLVMIVLQILE